jgi:septal ring factor EnvC (AmiA/AmiB activator)
MDNVSDEIRDVILAAFSLRNENRDLQERISQLWDALQASEEELYEVDINLAYAEKTIGELCWELEKSDDERRLAPFYI